MATEREASKKLAHRSGAGVALKRLIRALKPFNRRLDVRFNFFEPFACRCSFDRAGRQQECDAACLDISRSGMLLMTAATKIEPGAQTEVLFEPRRGAVVTVKGKVVRTFRLHTEKWYFSGVRFSDKKQLGIAFLLLSSSAGI
jgi:c-di-GMP-binding flagellar brake protein YcgR